MKRNSDRWRDGLRPVLIGISILFGFLLSGCTSTDLTRVQPWDRGTFTSYRMRPDRDPIATELTEHINFSREEANGGRGVGGSGCGCN